MNCNLRFLVLETWFLKRYIKVWFILRNYPVFMTVLNCGSPDHDLPPLGAPRQSRPHLVRLRSLPLSSSLIPIDWVLSWDVEVKLSFSASLIMFSWLDSLGERGKVWIWLGMIIVGEIILFSGYFHWSGGIIWGVFVVCVAWGAYPSPHHRFR